jgi:hypothetical protein
MVQSFIRTISQKYSVTLTYFQDALKACPRSHVLLLLLILKDSASLTLKISLNITQKCVAIQRQSFTFPSFIAAKKALKKKF